MAFAPASAREDIDALLMLAEQWYGWLPILAACDSARPFIAPLLCSSALKKRS